MTCPTPHKTSHPSAKAAHHALMNLWRTARASQVPIRYYHCVCGKYHLTKAPLRTTP